MPPMGGFLLGYLLAAECNSAGNRGGYGSVVAAVPRLRAAATSSPRRHVSSRSAAPSPAAAISPRRTRDHRIACGFWFARGGARRRSASPRRLIASQRIAIEPRGRTGTQQAERSASTSTPSTAKPTGTSRRTTRSACARSRTTSRRRASRSTRWRWTWSTRSWQRGAAARLAIPSPYWDWIRDSLAQREPHLYGRMDLAYDGHGPAKLYELNYDTPTSLYEPRTSSGNGWKSRSRRGELPAGADQYNRIQECLCEAFATCAHERIATPRALRRGARFGRGPGTVRTCATAREQAGIDTRDCRDRGHRPQPRRLVHRRRRQRDPHAVQAVSAGVHDARVRRRTCARSSLQLIEPAWKAVLSNKGVLPLLWERHAAIPNLLAAEFDDRRADARRGLGAQAAASRARAPTSRLHRRRRPAHCATDGPYDDGPAIRQAYHPLPAFDGHYPLVGSWVVADRARRHRHARGRGRLVTAGHVALRAARDRRGREGAEGGRSGTAGGAFGNPRRGGGLASARTVSRRAAMYAVMDGRRRSGRRGCNAAIVQRVNSLTNMPLIGLVGLGSAPVVATRPRGRQPIAAIALQPSGRR